MDPRLEVVVGGGGGGGGGGAPGVCKCHGLNSFIAV